MQADNTMSDTKIVLSPLEQEGLRLLLGRTETEDKTCAACGTQEVRLYHCGKCKAFKYCSKECQMKHWEAHKRACKAIHAYKQSLEPVARAVKKDTGRSGLEVKKEFHGNMKAILSTPRFLEVLPHIVHMFSCAFPTPTHLMTVVSVDAWNAFKEAGDIFVRNTRVIMLIPPDHLKHHFGEEVAKAFNSGPNGVC